MMMMMMILYEQPLQQQPQQHVQFTLWSTEATPCTRLLKVPPSCAWRKRKEDRFKLQGFIVKNMGQDFEKNTKQNDLQIFWDFEIMIKVKALKRWKGFFDVNTRGSKHWGEDCLQTPSTFNMMSQCALIGDLMSYRLSQDRFNRNNTKVNQRNHVFSASFSLATLGALPGHLTIPRFPGVEELPIWMWFGFWQIESISKMHSWNITNSGYAMLLRHS